MAEVRKKEKVEKYNIDELAVKNKKQEVKKVTWPTKSEVTQTSFMVLVLVAIAATFFFFVDQFFGFIVKLIFG